MFVLGKMMHVKMKGLQDDYRGCEAGSINEVGDVSRTHLELRSLETVTCEQVGDIAQFLSERCLGDSHVFLKRIPTFCI